MRSRCASILGRLGDREVLGTQLLEGHGVEAHRPMPASRRTLPRRQRAGGCAAGAAQPGAAVAARAAAVTAGSAAARAGGLRRLRRGGRGWGLGSGGGGGPGAGWGRRGFGVGRRGCGRGMLERAAPARRRGTGGGGGPTPSPGAGRMAAQGARGSARRAPRRLLDAPACTERATACSASAARRSAARARPRLRRRSVASRAGRLLACLLLDPRACSRSASRRASAASVRSSIWRSAARGVGLSRTFLGVPETRLRLGARRGAGPGPPSAPAAPGGLRSASLCCLSTSSIRRSASGLMRSSSAARLLDLVANPVFGRRRGVLVGAARPLRLLAAAVAAGSPSPGGGAWAGAALGRGRVRDWPAASVARARASSRSRAAREAAAAAPPSAASRFCLPPPT